MPRLGLAPAQARARGQALWTPLLAALAFTLARPFRLLGKEMALSFE